MARTRNDVHHRTLSQNAQAGTRRAAKSATSAGHSRRYVFGPYAAALTLTALTLIVQAAGGTLGVLSVVTAVVAVPGIVAGSWRADRPVAGIDRAEEVIYLGAVAAVAAAWCTAVTVAGWPAAGAAVVAGTWGSVWWLSAAGRLPLAAAVGCATLVAAVAAVTVHPWHPHPRWWAWPLAWAALTTMCAAPYWTHRRARRGVVVARTVGGIIGAAHLAGYTHLRAVGQKKDTGSVSTIPVEVGGGKGHRDLAGSARAIENHARLEEGSVTVQPDPSGRAGMALIVHRGKDREPPAAWPGSPGSITRPIPLGSRADRTVAALHLFVPGAGARHVIVGGITGGGKSVTLHDLIAGVVGCDDAIVVGIDTAKSGAEFRPWARRGAMPHLATDLPSARAVLLAGLALIKGRNQLIADASERAVGDHDPDKVWTPTRDAPAVAVILDEAARVLGADADCAAMMLASVQLGRSTAVSQVIASQQIKADAIGNADIRKECSIAVAHRMRGGGGYVLEGVDDPQIKPETIPAGAPGTFYLIGGTEPLRESETARSWPLARAAVADLAAARGADPVHLDEASLAAALDMLAVVAAEQWPDEPQSPTMTKGAQAIRRTVAAGAVRALAAMAGQDADDQTVAAWAAIAAAVPDDDAVAKPTTVVADGPDDDDDDAAILAELDAAADDDDDDDDDDDAIVRGRSRPAATRPGPAGGRPVELPPGRELNPAEAGNTVWALLTRDGGCTRAQLMAATGRGKTWASEVLADHERRGEAERIAGAKGWWQATRPLRTVQDSHR